METQKVILPFFYALFHAGFSSEENSSPILSPQKELALHSELTLVSIGITFRINPRFFRRI